jgi:stage IV sporulation protein FB
MQDIQVPDERPEESGAQTIDYPPKYQTAPASTNVWLRSLTSLALYLLLGYYIFPSYEMLLLITGIVMFHELGHFLAMKYFRYNDLGIFFIPLLGAYVSGTKREVSQRQSAIILLAGPLPGVLLGIGLYFLDRHLGGIYWGDISLYTTSLLLILLNLLNLLPIYPLDGGQLLNRVFLDEESLVSRIFIFVSVAAMAWFAWHMYSRSGNAFYLALIAFPVMLLLRLRTDARYSVVEKKLEAAGINLDTSYEEMPDEDYWKIRDVLIETQPAFRDLQPGPPYSYSDREDKMMLQVQGSLQRNLIQDVSLPGKIVLLLIWIGAFAAPWLLELDLRFFERFR